MKRLTSNQSQGNAGAQNVLMTLWSMDDVKAREFILHFYHKSLEADFADSAVALCEIQLSLIRETEPGLNNPRVWAPCSH